MKCANEYILHCTCNFTRLFFRLCDRKQWHTSRLIMGLPQGQKAKDNVMLRSYAGSTKTQAVLDWVNYNLASRIRYNEMTILFVFTLIN